MAITNYYTIDGSILGESTSGVRTSYAHDALGSVISTVDPTGLLVLNTYRYSPYDRTIFKTGVSADPKFQWVGIQGYRTTGLLHCEEYYRERHYGPMEARWTSYKANSSRFVLFGKDGGASSVLQNGGLPTGLPAGWRTNSSSYSTCGRSCWRIWWEPAGPRTDGWIIQHVHYDMRCWSCQPMGPCKNVPNETGDIYEAFQINGDGSSGDDDDRWIWPGQECAVGSKHWLGHARWYPGLSREDLRKVYPTGFPCTHSNNQFCSTQPPRGWHDRKPLRKMDVLWNCCGHPPKCKKECTPVSVSCSFGPDHYPGGQQGSCSDDPINCG